MCLYGEAAREDAYSDALTEIEALNDDIADLRYQLIMAEAEIDRLRGVLAAWGIVG